MYLGVFLNFVVSDAYGKPGVLKNATPCFLSNSFLVLHLSWTKLIYIYFVINPGTVLLTSVSLGTDKDMICGCLFRISKQGGCIWQ